MVVDEQMVIAAAKLLGSGERAERLYTSTGGRPRERYKLGSLELNRDEYSLALKQVPQATKVMTAEELVTFARSAVPTLMHRAAELAMQSDDIRAVLQVAKELADRGYGKSVQGVYVATGDDINAAWKELGVIDAEEAEATEKEKEDEN
jgi:hypothetical protein